MRRLFADSISQCLAHGECASAFAQGMIAGPDLQELGSLLSSPEQFHPDETIIVDLTGLGIQDAQIAKMLWMAPSVHEGQH
jgi:ornithine cyclodeaminase/alanine dehydrogenase-like protein (mu-crystallin family)